LQFINDNYGDLKNLNGSRCKTLQTAGEPRRFALYFIADLTFSYRLNAVCSVFPLRHSDFYNQGYQFKNTIFLADWLKFLYFII
jgi:hypothetical protein